MAYRLHLLFENPDAFRVEFERNIAMGGAFIPTGDQLKLRSFVDLVIELPFCDETVVLEAEVVQAGLLRSRRPWMRGGGYLSKLHVVKREVVCAAAHGEHFRLHQHDSRAPNAVMTPVLQVRIRREAVPATLACSDGPASVSSWWSHMSILGRSKVAH